MIKLSLLGPFELTADERPLTQLTAQKAQALLIYLAVEARQTHKRDALMALLWPDYPQKSAQQSLRQAVYLLRQAIEPENPDAPLILTERLTLALNPDAALMVDVDQFEELSGIGRSSQEWKQAVELYRGHFLADFYLPDSEPFEKWAANKRAYYQHRMQALLQRLVDYYLEIGDDLAAETAVRRQLSLDNLQEAAHRQLMEILVRNGRRIGG
jgi:DNA-binding SARP family transcriptional activator